MPFTLSVLVLAVAVSLLRGGRLHRIADAPLRSAWLLLVGLALQVAVDVAAARALLTTGPMTAGPLLASHLLVLVWVLRNWVFPGIWLIALGLGLNAAVIAANGAMPVDPAAIAALGLEGTRVPVGKHTLLTADTRLPWLADILPLPPLRTIISVGDVVLAAGLLPLTHGLMSYRSPASRRAALLAELRDTGSPLPSDEPGEPEPTTTPQEPTDPDRDEPTDQHGTAPAG